MPKYAEGARSKTGKYVVRGGKWVPVTVASRDASIERVSQEALGRSPIMAPEERRRKEFMAGSKVASAPYEEPTATGRAIGTGIETATMLGAGAGALPVAGRAVGTLLRFAGTPGGGAAIGAVEGSRRGPVEAVKGAVIGAAGGPLVSRAGKLLKFMARLRGGGGPAAKKVAEKLAAETGQSADDILREFGLKTGKEAAETAATAAPSELEAALQASLRAKTAPSVAQATVPGGHENLLLQLKDLSSTKAGRAQILEYIKTQPPEIARELRALLGPAVRHRVGLR